MTLEEAANHCERAWSSYATKHGIRREPDAFFLLKIQEELGELTRHFLEMGGNEHKSVTDDKLRRKFAGDCASLVGNALILARHFQRRSLLGDTGEISCWSMIIERAMDMDLSVHPALGGGPLIHPFETLWPPLENAC